MHVSFKLKKNVKKQKEKNTLCCFNTDLTANTLTVNKYYHLVTNYECSLYL